MSSKVKYIIFISVSVAIFLIFGSLWVAKVVNYTWVAGALAGIALGFLRFFINIKFIDSFIKTAKEDPVLAKKYYYLLLFVGILFLGLMVFLVVYFYMIFNLIAFIISSSIIILTIIVVTILEKPL